MGKRQKPPVIDLTKNEEHHSNDDDDGSSEPVYEQDHEEGEVADGDEYDGDAPVTEASEPREDHAEQAEGEKSKDSHEDDEEAEEKGFSLKAYNLTQKFDPEKGFGDVSEGDTVVIDTPLEGGKTGEVTDIEEAWTGTLHLKVDTGANQYDISPYEDQFSEQFIARVDEAGAISPDLLRNLGKTEMPEVEVGHQVMLDVPHVGPVRGTVAYKGETETQGTKIDVNCGPVSFGVYETPSPQQKKEQSVLIGRVQ